MKFEEAYSTFDKENHTIKKIQNIYIKTPITFAENYKESFLCPNCRLAKLQYNNAATPYFSAYPHAKHTPDCYLQQKELSPKSAEFFVQNSQNTTVLLRQMQSIINSLLPSHSLSSSKNQVLPTTIAIPSSSHTSKSSQNKRMTQKRFDLPLRIEDYNCYKYFYGKSRIKWEYDNRIKKHKLLLRNIEDNTFLGRIFITPSVYQYLSKEYKAPLEYSCYIVFAAKLSKTDKNYFEGTLYRSNHMIITKFSE